MPNLKKARVIAEIEERYGKIKKLPDSLSLFEIGNNSLRIYIRYSKTHQRNQNFFGLRKADLRQLEGLNSVLCFLDDTHELPIFIPYSEYEEIFDSLEPASDGQYKVSIYHQPDATSFYIANAGRFNVDGFIGWDVLDEIIDKSKLISLPLLTHSQIQTILGFIGHKKGFDIWVPSTDRIKLDWKLTEKFDFKSELPDRINKIFNIVSEIDTIWFQRGTNEFKALFEIEHSTPIYSGLLRFNDLHLTEPNLKTKFNIVSNELRRVLFLKQINRPTFRTSGLAEICSFFEYKDVYNWFQRLS